MSNQKAILDLMEGNIMTTKATPKRYVPPMAAKAGRVATDTLGTIYTLKDATTPGFKKPR
ncbi:MAG: hypothetical protein WCF33_16190 [Pseudonocardiaceae bacterium]